MHVLTTIYIPLLWFLIGKRLDRRGRMQPASFSKRRKALAVVALAGLFLAAILMLWFFAEGQRYTVAALSFAWIVSGIVAIWLRLRQPRGLRPEREIASSQ
jgi:peptidoglycan/LPS O-acetylase OafA/YrhL